MYGDYMKVTGIESVALPFDPPAGSCELGKPVGMLIGRTDLTFSEIKKMKDEGYVLFLRARTDTPEEVDAAEQALKEITDGSVPD